MRHDAVADLEQHFERAVGCVGRGEPAGDTRHLDGTFDAAPQLEEAPACKAVHVFMHKAGEACELAQQHGHGTSGIVTDLQARGEAMGGLLQVIEREPAIGREAVADLAALCTALLMEDSSPVGMGEVASTSMVSRKAAQCLRIGSSGRDSSARRAL